MDINNLIVWAWTFCGAAGAVLSEYLRRQYRIDMRVAGQPGMDPLSPAIIAGRQRLLYVLEPITVIITTIGLTILAVIYRSMTPAWLDRFVARWITEIFRWGMLGIAVLVLAAIAMLAYNSRDLIRRARTISNMPEPKIELEEPGGD